MRKGKDILPDTRCTNWADEKGIKEAWDTCPRGDWMLWAVNKLTRPKDITENNYQWLRQLTLAKAYCANTIRYLMKDARSTNAVDVAIQFGLGNATIEELRTAYAAATAATADATYAADAADAAAAAYTDATYAAHDAAAADATHDAA